jgi:3-deoxy-D-arabino-heptulosonate 7-phosphate (DAHP) synthase
LIASSIVALLVKVTTKCEQKCTFESRCPVLLKRGLSATVTEWLTAADADGLLIEAHPNLKEAMVDGLQSLTPSDFARLMTELKSIAEAVGRVM